MKSRDQLQLEIETLRDRSARLSAAALRISASLDLDTVLHEVVESARALTGARYGLVTTLDGRGQVRDFVSSGLTSEEHRQMADWPDGPRLFEHFRDLPAPVRLRDLRAYVRSLGFSSGLMPKTGQGTPMRHRGTHVGNFFLGDKEGEQEFTSEDEEILMLFASQAATAIANARTHQDEQRARADLETRIETSPVGVAVFDVKTGSPVSFNPEARRIVEGLRSPGSPPEDLLGRISFQRPDGREVSLAQLPLTQQLSTATTVRAEEIVLSGADGRSVRALVNATPIRATNGEVESVVVTMQDLAPLDELERRQTEFLSLVSHELRVPLLSIKGAAATVLDAASTSDPAEVREVFRIVDEQAEHMRGLISDLLDAGRIETGTLSVAPEPVEVAGLVDQARNTFLSGVGRQTVLLDLPPDLPRVMADRRRIVQVLNNLLSNASRHSPESSPIRVTARRDGVHVAVSVSDEGRGVPADRLPKLFQKHTGRADGDGGIGGSGLGLAICKGLVDAHGGRIWAESGGLGEGTRFTFTIPVVAEARGMATGLRASRSTSGRERRERTRILVVDDDPQTLRYVRDTLATAGFDLLVTGNPRELSDLIRTQKPHLVLLDLMLPGVDGIELMQRLPELADLAVIIISAYGRDETIARALELGAADYIVKPFSPMEFVARVRASLRRRAEPEPFLLGDLAIHYEERKVTMAGQTVQLTVTEYELLRLLSTSPGQVLTYGTLLRQVWGVRDTGDPNLVRTVIKNLRRKLADDAARPAYVLTERGVGYRMANTNSPGPLT